MRMVWREGCSKDERPAMKIGMTAGGLMLKFHQTGSAQALHKHVLPRKIHPRVSISNSRRDPGISLVMGSHLNVLSSLVANLPPSIFLICACHTTIAPL